MKAGGARLGALVAACVLASSGVQAAAAPGPAMTRLEQDVLAALNGARSQPAAYSGSLRSYRAAFRSKIVFVPGINARFATEEGVVPVDEAIAFLHTQPQLDALEHSPLLARAAADHVADQSASGSIGHYGADGSTPGQRAQRHGGGKGVAEVIAYGAVDAADVIRQLIVDDGVADRGHRILLYSQHLRYVGIACGRHPQFRTMCVIDMADTPDGAPGGNSRTLRIAQRGDEGGPPAGDRRP